MSIPLVANALALPVCFYKAGGFGEAQYSTVRHVGISLQGGEYFGRSYHT